MRSSQALRPVHGFVQRFLARGNGAVGQRVARAVDRLARGLALLGGQRLPSALQLVGDAAGSCRAGARARLPARRARLGRVRSRRAPAAPTCRYRSSLTALSVSRIDKIASARQACEQHAPLASEKCPKNMGKDLRPSPRTSRTDGRGASGAERTRERLQRASCLRRRAWPAQAGRQSALRLFGRGAADENPMPMSCTAMSASTLRIRG
jgi:hypothetical protein